MHQTDTNAKLHSIMLNTGKMLGILALTIGVTELLFRFTDFEVHNIILVYILAVLFISCVTPKYVYGLIASLFCTLAYDFFITEPRFGFTISFTIGSPLTLLTMSVVTIITSALIVQTQTQKRLAMEDKNRAQLLYEMNQRLLLAKDADTIVTLTKEYLVSHLECPIIFYTADPKSAEGVDCGAHASGDANAFGEDGLRRIHRIFKNGAEEAMRPQDDTALDAYYIPLISKDIVLGVIGIACKEEDLSLNNRDFVMLLTGQVTLALELQYLSRKQSRILVEAEKEKTRATLLRAISHDLRTPLTSILGASSTILEQKALSDPTYVSLVQGIRDDTQWLIRMVENLLVITRISGDNMRVRKTLEAAEEVIAQAVSIVRGRFPDYFIHVHIPDELIVVPMDATLISQVIINLLENAVKNSHEDSLILLNLEKKGGFAEFDINDNGKGIPEHLLDNLFEMHSPRTEQAVDASRGMGIGLSICKTIVQAHGGSIIGRNRKGGGASFLFRLPLEESVHG